jgi:hypothetical protein
MKHPGMMDDFLKVGKISGGGSELDIDRSDFDEINRHYFKGAKLGSRLHSLLRPIVKASDSVFGTTLGDCGGCAEREMKLNSI